MAITCVDDLADAYVGDEDAWRLYQHCFGPLNALAAQRHLMTRVEFDDVMHDKRIRKYLWVDEDGFEPRGISVYTNDLHAWPLVSPDYFAKHWPEHYAAGRIWYCGFVGVRGIGISAFAELVEAMWRVAADDGGIIFLDICAHNARRGLPAAIERRLDKLAGGVVARPVDEQVFWCYEFPNTTIGGVTA